MTGERKQPLIVILGPTAIGKTEVAIKLARALNGEIIGADSRQIYRYMDIGTAKPTAEEQQLAQHHLIDLIEPSDQLTLARYQRMAYEVIDDIHLRGKLPLLVGGTGQYISAVTEGWSIPEVPPNAELRDELEQFAAENGAEALHARLVELDHEAAARIHPNNIRRVVRAIEVCLVSGQPITELQKKSPPPYHILEFGLQMVRQRLYRRADLRVDRMMEMGLLDEVRRLLELGYNRRLPAMSGLGYAQLIEHILNDVPLEDAVNNIKTATHDFIRRQFTWFRGHDNGIMWHNVEQFDPIAIRRLCEDWLQSE